MPDVIPEKIKSAEGLDVFLHHAAIPLLNVERVSKKMGGLADGLMSSCIMALPESDIKSGMRESMSPKGVTDCRRPVLELGENVKQTTRSRLNNFAAIAGLAPTTCVPLPIAPD